MLFELRQYRMKPGQQQRWIQLMDEKIIPFQLSQGMVVVASFVGEQDDSQYVWIRRFASEEERDRLYKAVYESDFWKDEVAPYVGDLIDRSQTVVTRLTPTPMSVIR